MLVLFISNMTSATSGAETANTLVTPVPSQGHYGFQFSGCWLILSVYVLMSFDFPFVTLFGVR